MRPFLARVDRPGGGDRHRQRLAPRPGRAGGGARGAVEYVSRPVPARDGGEPPGGNARLPQPLATMLAFLDGLDAADSRCRATSACGRARPEDARPRRRALARRAPLHRRRPSTRASRASAWALTRSWRRNWPSCSRPTRDGPRRLPGRPEAYLELPNYTTNLRRFGFDRRRLRRRRQRPAHRRARTVGRAPGDRGARASASRAGADHVCIQPLGHGPRSDRRLPRAERRPPAYGEDRPFPLACPVSR